jgi:hypothetical protein
MNCFEMPYVVEEEEDAIGKISRNVRQWPVNFPNDALALAGLQ